MPNKNFAKSQKKSKRNKELEELKSIEEALENGGPAKGVCF